MKSLPFIPLPLLLLILLFLGGPAPLRAVGLWHRDYPEARAEAKAQGKLLLIVFTATDWVEICQKFYDDILGQPEFIEAVSGTFALVKLEYPKDSQLPREEALRKALLRDAYRVRGFPTVVLTDAEGRPFGMNGYQPVPAEDYAKQLLEIAQLHQDNLNAAAEAERLEGEAKAKALRLAIPDVPEALMARFYRKEMEAVLAADPQDRLQLATPFRQLIAEAEFEREIQVLAREQKWEEAIARTDRHIEELKIEGGALQAALIYRAGLERRAGKNEAAEATLRRVVVLDPESAPGQEAAKLLEAHQNGEAKAKSPRPVTSGEPAPPPAPALRAQPVP